jgi:hypothetical protein
MKILVVLITATFSVNSLAGGWNPLETRDQARQRQSNENYQTYQKQDNNLIPPSYNRPLGDIQQPNVQRPGYVMPDPYQNNYRSDPFNSR